MFTTQKAVTDEGKSPRILQYQVTEWKPVWSDDEKRIDGYDSIRQWVENVPADKDEEFLESFCDNSESYTVKLLNP